MLNISPRLKILYFSKVRIGASKKDQKRFFGSSEGFRFWQVDQVKLRRGRRSVAEADNVIVKVVERVSRGAENYEEEQQQRLLVVVAQFATRAPFFAPCLLHLLLQLGCAIACPGLFSLLPRVSAHISSTRKWGTRKRPKYYMYLLQDARTFLAFIFLNLNFPPLLKILF